MIVLPEGSSISAEVHWSSLSDHCVLGHLPDQGPSPQSLGGSKFLQFKNDGGHCVLGDLQRCRKFLVPFPNSGASGSLVVRALD